MNLTNEYQYIGRAGPINCDAGYQYFVLMYAKASGDVSTGKHTVSVLTRMASTIATSFYNWPTAGYVKAGGWTIKEWNMTPIPGKEWTTGTLTAGNVTYRAWVDMVEGSVVLNTGYAVSKDIVIETSWTMQGGAGQSWLPDAGVPAAASATVALAPILGASAITSVEPITLGKACAVKWTPLSSAFHYKLRFSLGTWSYTTGIISPKTTSGYTYTGYTIPLSVANQITNGPSGDMKVELFSYLDSAGATQIGSADSETVQATVPDDGTTKPAVSMTAAPVSSLGSAFSGLYIQNLTKVDAAVSATAKYGASIASTRLVVGGSKYTDPFVSDFLTATGEVTIVGEAVDSRGFTGRTEQIITVVPYSLPSIGPASGQTSIICARCDEDGNLSDSGTYLKIKAKRGYSPVKADGVQKNFCAIRYRVNGGNWVTILARTASGDEVDTCLSGVVSSVATAYTIEVGVVDDIGKTASASFVVPTEEVTFSLRKGGKGAAFGEYATEEKVLSVADGWTINAKAKRIAIGTTATEEGFTCAMPARFTGCVSISGLVDMIYPVGSIYMSVNDVSPSAFLGGTWERIQDRFLLAAGSAYAAGATGGAATHTLTLNEMPNHKHNFVGDGTKIMSENTVLSTAGDAYPTSPGGITIGANWASQGYVTLGNTGGGAAHNNMPPYLAVYIWKRTA